MKLVCVALFAGACLLALLTTASSAQEGSGPRAAGLPEGAGLAAKYPGDVGIEGDEAVVFVENF
ncbi:MAG: hypothetical protein KAX80_13165, partial [Planctomycetes bacterium]|nr:hypothetical protein [Planctomycetota bacterium]